MSEFGCLVKSTRDEIGWKQEALAGAVSVTPATISYLETGKDTVSMDTAVKVFDVMVKENKEERFEEWILCYLSDRVEKDKSTEQNRLRVSSALRQLKNKITNSHAAAPKVKNPTLVDFPAGFSGNWIVVVPDRRESTPKTKGDLCALSGSSGDLMYLLELKHLPAGTRLVSDKNFAMLNEQALKEQFGNTNILIVGSPAVNLAARMYFNDDAIWRFPVTSELDGFNNTIKNFDVINDPSYLRAFAAFLQDPGRKDLEKIKEDTGVAIEELPQLKEKAIELLGGTSLKDIMGTFHKAGIIDPVHRKLHGYFSRVHIDFGLVSMGKQPFSNGNHYYVYVAGIHTPGTAHCLKALSNPQFFKDRPLGGILEIMIDTEKPWSKRVADAHSKWQTESYSITSLASSLKEALNADPKSVNGAGLSKAIYKKSLEAILKIRTEC